MGYCNQEAFTAGGIATDFVEGSYCDEVVACTPDYAEEDLVQLIALPNGCDPTGAQCPGLASCLTDFRGDVGADVWDPLCAASLLPDVSLMCWIWGP